MDSEKNMEKLLKQLRRMSIEEKLLWFQVLKTEPPVGNAIKQYLSKYMEVNTQIIDLLNKELFEELSLVLNLSKLSPGKLSMDLEELGKITSDDKYNSLLICFLTSYSDDCVKEGAIYGLSYHMNDQIVYHRMKEMSDDEFISPLIKEIIRETIQTEDEIRNGK
jgi:hypothetical protein